MFLSTSTDTSNVAYRDGAIHDYLNICLPLFLLSGITPESFLQSERDRDLLSGDNVDATSVVFASGNIFRLWLSKSPSHVRIYLLFY